MRQSRRWLVLGVVLMGTFMAVLDVAIVNVAIPSIHADLGASYGQIEFVVSAYTLTYACLLVTGGRLGDNYGRKLLFIVGLIVFGAASAGCGMAPTTELLIAARAVQGIGGALMYPQVLAIIQVNFADQERAKALGIFGSVIGVAAVAGQILGGAIIALDIWHLEWRPIFLVNVPLVLATIIAAAFILPKDDRTQAVGLDWGGVTLITAALMLLTVPLLEGRDFGWPLWMLACLAASVPAFAAFVWYERRFGRRGGRPLVRMELFACKSFAVGVPIAALFMASYVGYLFTLALYLQVGLGFSALQSGLTYTPTAIGFFITSLAAPRLIPLLGRQVLTVGYIIGAFGLLVTATTVYSAGAHLHGFELAPSLFLTGLGNGLGLSPLVGTVISGLAPEEAGVGAGVVTTTLQVGSALGVALIGLLFFVLLGGAEPGAAYADAFAVTLPACAALLLLAAVLVRRLPRTPYEVANALVERLPGWSAGFAYSMFLMTGGRLGDGLVHDLVAHVIDRRLQRVREAPQAIGEFLAFHFRGAEADLAWLHYLMREALVFGNGPVPDEEARQAAVSVQVQEICDRQSAGLLPADLPAGDLRLMGFALMNYPRMRPQITRMTTGMTPDNPTFVASWEVLLRKVGSWLEEAARHNPAASAVVDHAPPQLPAD
jgi:EmrB/QacA subfamily drug resistance transporter